MLKGLCPDSLLLRRVAYDNRNSNKTALSERGHVNSIITLMIAVHVN